MTFILSKNVFSIDSMQIINSILEKLVKNLPDNYFKYSTQEFGKKRALKTKRCLSLLVHGQF